MGSGQKKIFPKGFVLFSQDDHTQDIYVLLKGGVEITIKGSHISYIVENGSYLGEMSYLLGHKRTATATTIHESEFIVISEENIEKTIRSNPTLAIKLAKTLAVRLNKTSNELLHYIESKAGQNNKKVYKNIEDFLAKGPYDIFEEILTECVKEHFFSKQSGFPFEYGCRMFERFKGDLKSTKREKDFISNPLEKLSDQYEIRYPFIQKIEDAYDKIT